MRFCRLIELLLFAKCARVCLTPPFNISHCIGQETTDGLGEPRGGGGSKSVAYN